MNPVIPRERSDQGICTRLRDVHLLGVLLTAVWLLVVPGVAHAQMAVTGRVTSGDQPVRAATVTIRDLGISTQTNEAGAYSFLIRAAQIRGQTVTIVARHSRYGSQSAQLTLAGEPIELNFSLRTFDQPVTPEVTATQQVRPPLASRVADSSAVAGSAGPLDVASALAGKIPGLVVTSATAGGSSRMEWRGPRSIIGSGQPLVVVDGIALQNSSMPSASQRFGLGGLDYGSPLADLAIDEIATVTMLSGASAVPQYGTRAANGVLLITTKQGSATRSLQLFSAVRFSGESPVRLPAFQNQYGQGLNGQFEFFDGQGGGINDAVEESWGPALDGQPIAQASLTEPRRPDVRHWLPHPSGVRDYYSGGRTLEANIGLDGSRQWLSGRASLNARNVTGTTSGAGSGRLGVALAALAQPSRRFTGRANLQVTSATAEGRHGTGFDEINPAAGFTRMGRQIDLDTLRSAVSTGTEQINWIYTGRNNPFFQTERNSNDDTRQHVLGSGSLRYDIGRGISAILAAGADVVNEDRNVDVARGWKGQYPTALGRRDFSGGGSEQRTLESGERTFSLALQSAPRRSLGWDIGVGGGFESRRNRFNAVTTVADTATITATDSASTMASAFFIQTSASRAENVTVEAGIRLEKSSFFPDDFGFAILPALSISYDAARHLDALRNTARLGAARLKASWWRAANELTPLALGSAYIGGGTMTDPVVGIRDSARLPERTSGLELGAELASTNGRVELDAAGYRERSTDVLVASSAFVGQVAEISNKGFEVQLRLVPFGDVSGAGNGWNAVLSFARNANDVERFRESLDAPLGPPVFGATLSAREDEPIGVILGTRYLRDSVTHALVLRNGLPIADATGVHALGSTRPDWTSSLRSTLRFGRTEIAALFDARMGGKVFSATNMWGTQAGTLESTLAGRESGLVVAGIDTVTRDANTTNVSAQDYYHAQAAITEAFVFDGSYWKLREARLTYELGLRFVPGFREHVLRASIVGRNLAMGAKAPNIDPETLLSTGAFVGFEMGQLPTTRSIGIHVSIAP